MDEKLKTTIEKIVQLSKQNPEFDTELRKKLVLFSAANSVIIDDERLNLIYEYCIEKVARKQGEEFYSSFPIPSITSMLIDDYVRMEYFKRKDNFQDFCLALYQQIECITNKMCESPILHDIVTKMWGYPAYIKLEKGKELSISDRLDGDFSIGKLVFVGDNKIEKSKMALQNLYAIDKIRTIVYFLGYKAMMKSSDYDSFKEITSLLNDIYQCRNLNHRGNTTNQWEQEIQDRVLPLKSFYYFKFLGVLAQYVSFIKNGIDFLPSLKTYASSLEKKEMKAELNVVDKIDLSKLPDYSKWGKKF